MGRLIYSMNVSLDGFIASPDGDLGWADVDHELHEWFNELARSTTLSLYGRRMYELMAAYWPTAEDDPAVTETERSYARIWNRTPKIVFSRTLEAVRDGCRLAQRGPVDVVRALRREHEGDIDVSGATLAAQLIEADLVDVYMPVVHPVVVGGGTPFWPALQAPRSLRLVGTRTFASGAVALHLERPESLAPA